MLLRGKLLILGVEARLLKQLSGKIIMEVTSVEAEVSYKIMLLGAQCVVKDSKIKDKLRIIIHHHSIANIHRTQLTRTQIKWDLLDPTDMDINLAAIIMFPKIVVKVRIRKELFWRLQFHPKCPLPKIRSP